MGHRQLASSRSLPAWQFEFEGEGIDERTT